jgi:hypothetical protein
VRSTMGEFKQTTELFHRISYKPIASVALVHFIYCERHQIAFTGSVNQLSSVIEESEKAQLVTARSIKIGLERDVCNQSSCKGIPNFLGRLNRGCVIGK